MCEGQNNDIQNYLRVQTDNLRTFDLVSQTAQVFRLFARQPSSHSVLVLIKVRECNLDFCSKLPLSICLSDTGRGDRNDSYGLGD